MRVLGSVALVLAFILAACTPTEVAEFFEPLNVELTTAETEAIAEWTVNRDCIPGYDSGVVVECAILDSWLAYDVPVSLETWARIAWCESNHQPEAKNPRSSASGLFQNLARYWDGRAEAAGFPDGDIWNPRVHAFVSAHLAETGGVGHWNPSRHCWS